ncbi:hypothetical protein FB45DRAFT_895977 [Roridomyces roridus]|uniref:Uncharacterized protein n=1 Tax=Roridomyces roridus TaxID=1738132 RepID=A0AAD7FY18_9AGAR|nr:hypothetical protein FB45DRAFT_895977 [Roridomyces roridus]
MSPAYIYICLLSVSSVALQCIVFCISIPVLSSPTSAIAISSLSAASAPGAWHAELELSYFDVRAQFQAVRT